MFKAAVWYNGKTVNQDGNNPRYVGGIVKFIDVDPNTKVAVFLCTVRDIFGIPEAVPITMKYHIFFSSEISKLLDITPYGSLKSMLQPGLMLHPFYVEENVVKDVTDTISNMPRCSRSARNSNAIQSPPTGVEIPVKPSASAHVDGSLNHAQNSFQTPVMNRVRTRQSIKRSVKDRDDPVSAVIVGDRVGRTSSTDSSQMRIIIKSLCGLEKPLDVESSETVRSIKEKICKIEGTAVEDQRLFHLGSQLRDDHNLAYIGISDGSTIHISQCMRGC
ncbi:hypothetical protein MKW98_004790 [Papaver atlanticum]|uniref:Ubiquitin-like domain-containing protein n=1 Tax=Papaver atlanticum TaxID=357466 RepID=A0AAD4XI87_9MAGN|nr:hypothetical protein MKW98_004790 [Papaver atlanticum]